MRLLRVTTLYPEYIASFYAARPGLARESYAVQRKGMAGDFFGWADSWRAPLATLGWQMEQIEINAAPLQRAWAREHLPRGASLSMAEIAIEQARHLRPDLLWYDHEDPVLLGALRGAVPDLRAVVGWTGSPIMRTDAWPQMDLMLSCAPEAAERCRRAGLDAAVLPHAFDPHVLEHLRDAPVHHDVSFIGQLVRGREFHDTRLRLLTEVAAQVPLTLFVPRPRNSWRRAARQLLSGRWPRRSLPREFSKVGDGVYGLAMYQVLRESRATLNIHADSSPRFASNMRLFEATGVGSCLVTDWKEDLGALFEPDREVMTYRDAGECVSVLRWLAEHPHEAKAIAAAGQRRTLASYTFAHRAPLLDEHLRTVIR